MIVTAHSADDYEVFREFALQRGVRVPALGPGFQVVGRLDSRGQLVAVLEFSGFAKRTCNVHITGNLTPDLIRAGIKYAYVTCNLVQMFGHVSVENQRLRDLLTFIGFVQHFIVKRGWDENTDIVVMGMHRSQCRWLKER